MTDPEGTKWALVDTDALERNTAAVCAVAGPAAVMAMVKANGYGHGAVHAATAALAGGATWLGVSSIAEAVELREAGISTAILNVGWSRPEEIPSAIAHDIDLTVFDVPGVRAMHQAADAMDREVRVHWKIDTGMGRLGTPYGAITETQRSLEEAHPRVRVVGLFTHFADADGESTAFTVEQHTRFLDVVSHLRSTFPDALVHCANSAALLRLPETHHDIVRAGIVLYGYPPDHTSGLIRVQPALQFEAMVTQVKEVVPGQSVGYGREWVATSKGRVATVAAGYADGVDRRYGNRGQVIIAGVLCPVVGRVSMDQLSADISETSGVEAGDVATIIGRAGGRVIDAADVAATIDTIPYEVLCSISGRVPRIPVCSLGLA